MGTSKNLKNPSWLFDHEAVPDDRYPHITRVLVARRALFNLGVLPGTEVTAHLTALGAADNIDQVEKEAPFLNVILEDYYGKAKLVVPGPDNFLSNLKVQFEQWATSAGEIRVPMTREELMDEFIRHDLPRGVNLGLFFAVFKYWRIADRIPLGIAIEAYVGVGKPVHGERKPNPQATEKELRETLGVSANMSYLYVAFAACELARLGGSDEEIGHANTALSYYLKLLDSTNWSRTEWWEVLIKSAGDPRDTQSMAWLRMYLARDIKAGAEVEVDLTEVATMVSTEGVPSTVEWSGGTRSKSVMSEKEREHSGEGVTIGGYRSEDFMSAKAFTEQYEATMSVRSARGSSKAQNNTATTATPSKNSLKNFLLSRRR